MSQHLAILGWVINKHLESVFAGSRNRHGEDGCLSNGSVENTALQIGLRVIIRLQLAGEEQLPGQFKPDLRKRQREDKIME